MRDLLAILRRELFRFTATPMGAIVLVAFYLLAVGLFAPEFFLLPTADMRPFFTVLPFVLCAVLPAVTMHLWAGERSQGTLELLLVLPVRPVSLVLAKFLAAMAFVLVALASTGVIPLMFGVLGAPDWGQIAASYLGAVLLCAMFVALGQLASGFAADQTSAFVLALGGAFGLYLLGSDFAAMALDGWHPGLGTLLRRLFGAASYFAPFVRGLVEVPSVVFFLLWTTIFLFLNGLALEHRGQQGFRLRFAAAAALCITIGALSTHLLSQARLPRLDLTQSKIHSLSPATARILQNLPAPIQVTYYVTPAAQMPTELKSLERDVMDRLEAMSAQAPEKMVLRRVYLQAANVVADSAQASDLERQMLAKGVQPISVAAVRQTGTVSELVYTSIGIAYRDKPEEILPAVVPNTLGELEYLIASTALRLARATPPTVAVASGPGQFTEMSRMLEREGYTVRPVSLEEPLPQADAIVLVQPQLSDKARYQLARALAQGARIFLAVQQETWDYSQALGRLSAVRIPLNSNIEAWLAPYGVRLVPDILMDEQSIAVRVATNPWDQLTGGGMTLKLPTHILVTRQHMAPDPMLLRVDNLVYLWGSALELTDTNATQITRTPLAWTSPQAWTIPQEATLTPQSITPPDAGRRSYPVLVRLAGEFPAPQGPPPADAGATAHAVEPWTPAPGELLITGCSSMFADGLVSTNAELLFAALDGMVFGEDLLRIRPKELPSRVLPPLSPQAALAWKIVLHAAVPLMVLGISILTALRRRAQERHPHA